MCVYALEWIVSKKSQVTMQLSNSGSEQYGKNAITGPRPCTLSNSVWYFKFAVNICFCSGRNCA